MDYSEGTWHTDVIKQVLLTYKDPIYLEIGVRYGTSFNHVLPYTKEAHGVDIDQASHSHMNGGTFYHMDSDTFFDQVKTLTPDVVFIDGEHTYEQVKKDFFNALDITHKYGTIILHDTWPVVEENESACGTVHKFARQLESTYYRNYLVYTYRRFPGVTIVQMQCPSWES